MTLASALASWPTRHNRLQSPLNPYLFCAYLYCMNRFLKSKQGVEQNAVCFTHIAHKIVLKVQCIYFYLNYHSYHSFSNEHIIWVIKLYSYKNPWKKWRILQQRNRSSGVLLRIQAPLLPMLSKDYGQNGWHLHCIVNAQQPFKGGKKSYRVKWGRTFP